MVFSQAPTPSLETRPRLGAAYIQRIPLRRSVKEGFVFLGGVLMVYNIFLFFFCDFLMVLYGLNMFFVAFLVFFLPYYLAF